MFALAGMVGAVVATPIAVYASHQFTDVANSHLFHNDIDWMRDNGITFGCGGGKYCPDDFVTRGEMGGFLRRLSEKKVVDAATAVNAGKVDGFSANQLLRVAFGSTDDAPDSDGSAVLATIVAPKAGWLILSASIDAFSNIPDVYSCSLTVDGGLVAGTFRLSAVNWSNTHTVNNQEHCSTTGVQQVTAGTHTFALTIVDRDTVDFRCANIWALFVPFDGEGNTPLVLIPLDD